MFNVLKHESEAGRSADNILYLVRHERKTSVHAFISNVFLEFKSFSVKRNARNLRVNKQFRLIRILLWDKDIVLMKFQELQRNCSIKCESEICKVYNSKPRWRSGQRSGLPIQRSGVRSWLEDERKMRCQKPGFLHWGL
jgi:hypothetical protein